MDDPDDVADEPEPPMPAGLQKLTPALQRLAQFFDIDPHLIESAAGASPTKTLAVSDTALQQAIAQLTREECNEFLFRLAQGEAGLGLALKHKLRGILKTSPSPKDSPRRPVRELLRGARRLREQAAQRQKNVFIHDLLDEIRHRGSVTQHALAHDGAHSGVVRLPGCPREIPPTTPSATSTTPPGVATATLVPADSDAPAAGICAEAEGEWATVQIAPDAPSPRCLKVTREQRLKVINGTQAVVQIKLGEFALELQPGIQGSLETPFGEYLAPGVHRLMVSPYAGPELWLVEK